VLVAKLSVLLTLLDDDESCEEAMSVLFELLEDSANWAAVSREADCASCAALEDDLLVAKSSVVAVFADRLLLEERSRLADNDLLLVELLVLECAVFLVAFAANAPPETVVSLFALPVVVDVAPPLDALVLDDEAPLFFALPSGPAAAKFRLAPEPDVLLLECDLSADASSDAEAVLALVASSAAFVANEFVVPLDLVAFAEADNDSFADRLLLALACWAWSLLLLKLLVELLLRVLLSVNDLSLVVE